MSELELKRSLSLVRYGGVVVTLMVFVILLVFALVVGTGIDKAVPGAAVTGMTLGSLFPYIIGLTILAGVLSIALFFGYRAYLMGRVSKA
ncbi:MAG: hypothetical protein ABI947_26095 [Chloroflexota bacterium]